MTYLGTRPPLISETNLYELHHRARLAIKPGITGMWQVSGRSDITDFEEVVRLDKEYITNWNIGLDMANPDSQNPLEEDAVILIDELDLHLHPKWQKEIVDDLKRTFPNCQFIVSTHSPCND